MRCDEDMVKFLPSKKSITSVAKFGIVNGIKAAVVGGIANAFLGPIFGPMAAGVVAGALIPGDVGKTIAVIGITEGISNALGTGAFHESAVGTGASQGGVV